MKKNDLKLVSIFFIIIMGIFCINRFFFQENGSYAVVSIDGEQYESYSLETDRIISIGETNQAEIKNHYVLMTSANCPDKLCVHQKAIGKKGETIICLPNKVVIEVKGNKEQKELDAIVN